ncbi:MAG TPA: aldehyde dehydrogenase family protein, partial [Candidatus Limnocylindria bacterium]|nr:aldehyde dehydrogenase family protein [Candidatus Limnocylindria bacterium]
MTASIPALNYIGGAWVESTSRERARDVNPARSSESLGDATVSTPADVTHAIDAAAAAYQEWRRTPAPQRGDIVRKAADLMERRRMELAR